MGCTAAKPCLPWSWDGSPKQGLAPQHPGGVAGVRKNPLPILTGRTPQCGGAEKLSASGRTLPKALGRCRRQLRPRLQGPVHGHTRLSHIPPQAQAPAQGAALC